MVNPNMAMANRMGRRHRPSGRRASRPAPAPARSEEEDAHEHAHAEGALVRRHRRPVSAMTMPAGRDAEQAVHEADGIGPGDQREQRQARHAADRQNGG